MPPSGIQPLTGRPVGSSSGRQPVGGYPAVDKRLGPFLAGLIEGEATFGIGKQSRNTNHRCVFALRLRDDDAPMLYEIVEQTKIGRIVHVPPRSTSRAQVAWMVAAKADCLRLVDVLNAYPLRGRKGHDFAIWAAAVLWWTDGDATKTIRNRDWTALQYLRVRLQQVKRYTPALHPIMDDVDGLEADWPGFLAGFFTAEGHLGISVNGSSLIPRAQIAVRRDDWPLLAEFRRRTGLGRIYHSVRNSPRNPAPSAAWTIRSGDELTGLVHIFDRHSLRGRKLREFHVWRQAVLEYASDKPRRAIRETLAVSRKELAEVRAYDPVRARLGTSLPEP